MPKARYDEDTVELAALILALYESDERDEEPATPPSLWQPISYAQQLAIETEADELYYGGAAGGGKSDLMLGLAITEHYSTLILRREYPQLEALIERSHELLDGTGARYNEHKHLWRDVPGGRQIRFGSVPTDQAKKKYQGQPRDLLCFDELPQFTSAIYNFIVGWNRSTDRRVKRVRIVNGGNPPLEDEQRWVIEYWAPWIDRDYKGTKARPGELRYFATLENENGRQIEVEDNRPFVVRGIEVQPVSRTFVPARLQDNPELMKRGYGSRLNAMPEPLRSLLLFGDYEILANAEDDPWQLIPTEWIDAAMKRWRETYQPYNGITRVAVDTATSGDLWVAGVLRGNYVDELHVVPGAVTPDGFTSALRVVEAMGIDPQYANVAVRHAPWISTVGIMVDVIGAGGSATIERLREWGFTVHSVHGNAASYAMNRERTFGFDNLRSELGWRLREKLDPINDDVWAIPDDKELREELRALRWGPGKQDKVKVLDKADVKKKLGGRSPNRADALMMLAHDPPDRNAHVPTSTSGRIYGVGGPVRMHQDHNDIDPNRYEHTARPQQDRMPYPNEPQQPTTGSTSIRSRMFGGKRDAK